MGVLACERMGEEALAAVGEAVLRLSSRVGSRVGRLSSSEDSEDEQLSRVSRTLSDSVVSDA